MFVVGVDVVVVASALFPAACVCGGFPLPPPDLDNCTRPLALPFTSISLLRGRSLMPTLPGRSSRTSRLGSETGLVSQQCGGGVDEISTTPGHKVCREEILLPLKALIPLLTDYSNVFTAREGPLGVINRSAAAGPPYWLHATGWCGRKCGLWRSRRSTAKCPGVIRVPKCE